MFIFIFRLLYLYAFFYSPNSLLGVCIPRTQLPNSTLDSPKEASSTSWSHPVPFGSESLETEQTHQQLWLVVKPPLWKKYEFVNWDDNRNPILVGKVKNGNQTTNQLFIGNSFTKVQFSVANCQGKKCIGMLPSAVIKHGWKCPHIKFDDVLIKTPLR